MKNIGKDDQNETKPFTSAPTGSFNRYITISIIAFIVGLGLGLSITKNPSLVDKKINVYSQTDDTMPENILSTDNVVWPEVSAEVLTVSDQVSGLEINI